MDPADAEVVTLPLGRTMLQVWPKGRCIQALFKDCTTAAASPQDTEDCRAIARALGYGDDTWLCCLEHMVFHVLLAAVEGRTVSPALWSEAHGLQDIDRTMIAEEEARVLIFQRRLNECRGRV